MKRIIALLLLVILGGGHSVVASDFTPTQPPLKEIVALQAHTVAPKPIRRVSVVPNCDKWYAVADKYVTNEVEGSWVKRVMRCESTCNEKAYNASSSASGIMQFLPSTYRANGGKDMWDGEEQIQVALRMYRMGQAYQWSCK